MNPFWNGGQVSESLKRCLMAQILHTSCLFLWYFIFIPGSKVKNLKFTNISLDTTLSDFGDSIDQDETSQNIVKPVLETTYFNPLPNDKNLDLSKLKPFADDKINVKEKLKLSLERVENIVGKGENAVYQHFLLFPKCFQRTSVSGSFKVGIDW